MSEEKMYRVVWGDGLLQIVSTSSLLSLVQELRCELEAAEDDDPRSIDIFKDLESERMGQALVRIVLVGDYALARKGLEPGFYRHRGQIYWVSPNSGLVWHIGEMRRSKVEKMLLPSRPIDWLPNQAVAITGDDLVIPSDVVDDDDFRAEKMRDRIDERERKVNHERK